MTKKEATIIEIVRAKRAAVVELLSAEVECDNCSTGALRDYNARIYECDCFIKLLTDSDYMTNILEIYEITDEQIEHNKARAEWLDGKNKIILKSH